MLDLESTLGRKLLLSLTNLVFGIVRTPNGQEQIMQTTTLEIDGMHCQGCVQIVQHVIEQQAGVKGCSVSLDPQQARVAHDADQVSAQTLVKAVREAGYTAAVGSR